MRPSGERSDAGPASDTLKAAQTADEAERADSTGDPEAGSGGGRPGGGDLRVWALALAMAAAASALLRLQSSHLPPGPPPVEWWSLIPLFALTEAYAIHLPTARNAHSHTIREVPAVAGFAFLSPVYFVGAYVIGSGAGLLWRSQRGVKLAFNLCLFALEAALGQLVFHAVIGGSAPAQPRGWLAAFAAITVTDLVAASAVTAAISLTEGVLDAEVLKDALSFGIPAAMVNTCMALLLVVLLTDDPEAIPLLAVAVLVIAIAYRAYVQLERGYSRLRLLYRFVGSAVRAPEVEDAVKVLLNDARELLGADRAELVMFAEELDTGQRFSVSAEGELTRRAFGQPDPGRDAWWSPAALGEPVLRARQAKARIPQARPSQPMRDGLAVPLRTDGRVVGVLAVVDRAFERQTFSAEDLRLLETLAGHAAVELDKARLLDRLRRIAAERKHEAHHDALTGLPNRRAFHEAVKESADRTGAVLLIDLDDFKDVNDTLGHSAGDGLLVEVGRRLRDATDSMVARLGGDEFAVLFVDVDGDQARERAHALLDRLSGPIALHNVNVYTAASIGIALRPDHGEGTDELLQHADVAMYVAKRAGTAVEIYRTEDAMVTHRRLKLAGDLSVAVQAGAYDLWYQPQADAVSGQIRGVEALVRWTHAAYGAIEPTELVALAERTGLLRRLTDGVLEKALTQRAEWARAGHDLAISVNVTPTDLCDSTFPKTVADLLASTGTPASALTLEITESSVMTDPARCLAVLDTLASLGVKLSIDDFGTGYSSLAYLERLPVTEIKIDRSFLSRLESELADPKVVRATIALARDLHLSVVAEGVETHHGWRVVSEFGAHLIQGFALARPMSAPDMTTWLSTSSVSALSA
jgi:diguanylate cyclase (GGDEF)-like protein